MPTDPNKRRQLIEHCNRYAERNDGAFPAVTLEQFFDGNDDVGSIMCNRMPESTALVRDQLLRIRLHPHVESLLIRIWETNEEDEPCWPFAEQVILVTSLAAQEVRSLFDPELVPDDIWVFDEKIEGVPKPRLGSRALVAWWD